MSSSRFVVHPVEDQSVAQVPKVKAVKPFGSTILVEMLNADEALGTKVFVSKGAQVGAPQAYVLALGPKLTAEDTGLNVGDRVMLQGTYIPVPNFDQVHRQRGIVELHNVKAVMVEDENEND